MGKGKKRKLTPSRGKVTKKHPQTKLLSNLWVRIAIGAGAGLVVWLALRYIVPMLGGNR
jgi:hypothetical protein